MSELPTLPDGMFWRIEVRRTIIGTDARVDIQIRKVRRFPWRGSRVISEDLAIYMPHLGAAWLRSRVLRLAHEMYDSVVGVGGNLAAARAALGGLLGDTPPDWRERR